MQAIDRDTLKEMLDRGEPFALVEVLPRGQYRKFHLPGAVNAPLDRDFAQTMEKLVPDRHETVVVYCSDAHCQASPQAGRMLEEMGYTDVLHYPGGKKEWRGSGLPLEGEGGEARPQA